MDQHRAAFPEEVACVNPITANLEGDAAKWMVALHDEGALKLEKVNAFLEGPEWAMFRDPT